MNARSPFVTLRVATLAAAASLAVSAGAHAALVVVDVKTNYEPYRDFIAVRAFMETGDAEFETIDKPAFVGQPFLTAVRVAEFQDVDPGFRLLTVDLLQEQGGIIDRRTISIDVRNNIVVTALITRPAATAQKTVDLLTDADGDGFVSAGDIVRYSVVVESRAAHRFSDQPGAGTRLVAGSVTTTSGTVAQGNGPSDTAVLVSDLSRTDPTTIRFDAEVVPVIENQGRLLLSSGSTSHVKVLTDDPTTGLPQDATVTPVSCAAGGLLEDSDGDGVAAVLDRCPGTPAGQSVDDRGCSLVQFCAAIPLDGPDGAVLCRQADWRDDEPLGDPRDCRPRDGLCRVK